ncbi:MAG: hypothetical protein JWM57_3635 [Phycisphaerales bacterium]|nr:hypothetical protein [Phycisphaerales bacterium]
MALAIVAAVEVFLHTRDRLSLIAYASDEGQYHAVRDTVRAIGPAEVALVGSSQMREGVVMPALVAELEKRLGRKVRVANYATRGARLDAMNGVVRFLQKQPNPPKLIVVGLGPRDLRADTVDWPRVALFWDAGDWWKTYKRYGFGATDLLPVVIRNLAGRVLYTLNFREEISLALQRPFMHAGLALDTYEDGNPILGQVSSQHEGSRGQRSLSKLKVPLKKLFDRAVDSYMFAEPAKARPAMKGALHDLVNAFAANPQQGLLVQMPVARVLQAAIDNKGQSKAFLSTVTAEATATGVGFIPSDKQGVHPTDDDFSDLQHLNRPGAEAFGIWLANEIAARLSNQ